MKRQLFLGVATCLILSWAFPTESPVKKDELIGYIHVPKCAGSSFFSIVGSILAAKNIRLYPPTDGKSFNAPGCTARVGGGTHCGYSELLPCLQQNKPGGAYKDVSSKTNIKFITIIRDPADRMVSEYFWWAPCNHKTWLQQVCKLPLMEWMRSPFNVARNRMAKMLVNVREMMSRRLNREFCVSFSASNSMSYWLWYYSTTAIKNASRPQVTAQNLEDIINNDDDLLQNIKNNIRNNFAFVGVQEFMESSVQELAALYGFQNVSALNLQILHSSAERNDREIANITADNLLEIRRLNRLDYEIYEWVVETYYNSSLLF